MLPCSFMCNFVFVPGVSLLLLRRLQQGYLVFSRHPLSFRADMHRDKVLSSEPKKKVLIFSTSQCKIRSYHSPYSKE